MAKNLIPEIAHMLGVELSEEFEIEGYKGLIYQFTDDELIVRSENDTESVYTTANMTLVSLLRGKREIIKLPWKPKAGDTFYSFYTPAFAFLAPLEDKTNYKWSVSECIWNNTPVALGLLKAGWVYRSKEEAEAALPKVAKEIGVEYEL